MPTMSVSMVRMAVPMKSTTKPHMTARWKTPAKRSRVADRSNIWAGSSAAQALGQRRHDLEDVGHRPVVGDTEDRCVRVRVDGHDQLGVAHPLQVLRRAADTEREVQLRFQPQAGLADLACPRQPARV